MDLHDLDWPRRTARLELRPGRADDADAIWRWRRLPEVNEWLTAAPTSREDHRERWASHLHHGLVVLLDGVNVGTGKVHVEDAWAQEEVADGGRGAQAELGWMLDPAVQGQGLGTELVRELMFIAWELGVRRVVGLAFADNVASTRVMEKAGMRREALLREESLHRTRGWVDGVIYAALRSEHVPGADRTAGPA